MSKRQRGPAAGEPADVSRPVSWPSAFDELYRTNYGPMVRLAALITGSAAVAEEVVQDAFLCSRDALAVAERPAAYLRVAVVNGCRTFHRRQALALVRLPRSGMLPTSVDPALDELSDVLAVLPARQRQVLVLRYYADCSETEIAALLGCRPGTVKSLAHRGLTRLRELLQPEAR